MSLITEYPAWFIIFCLSLGLLYAGILYYKNRNEEFSLNINRGLALLRFLAIFIISFLLLSPLVKSVSSKTEKPMIIIAQDNSESLVIGKDSAYYKTEYSKAIKEVSDQLANDYEVKTFTFGDKVSEASDFSFDEKQTDISVLFDEMSIRFSNRNVGALVLASDGLFNRGLNPLYTSEPIRFPVYSLALGDTAMRKDVFLNKVNFNRIAFVGNQFPVEVSIGANMCNGQQSTLSVLKGGSILHSENISFKSNTQFQTVQLQFEATEPGMQRYTIRLSAVADEISTVNNSQDIFIDILDSKQKILLLSSAPHPDIAALKSAIETNFNYELTESTINDYMGQIESFNLVIMHQLPTGGSKTATYVARARESKIPVLYILGVKTNLAQFNGLSTGIEILSEQRSFNETLPVLNPEFTLFTLSEESQQSFGNFPPLLTPFGEYKTLNSASTLFYQQIGSLVTGYPLVLFNQTLDSKTGVVTGEGLWKWRLQDYLKNGNHDAFNEIVSKMIQFLSVKVDKSFFRVEGENNFLENESVNFDAEVYNQSYELINTNDVEINIINSNGDEYPFVFGKTAKSYQLDAGILPVDNYTWDAKVRDGEKIYTDNGAFTVSPLNIEALSLIADHNLLFQLAEKTNGQMIYPDKLMELPETLKQREDITTITYTHRKYDELVNIPWVFGIILLLISLEWFIRKRGGSY